MRIGLLLRHALRGLRGRPAFTILNAAVLAVGVAGVTTIAGLVGGLLLRPLPYAHAERLVLVLGGDRTGGGAQTLSGAELALLREQARSFEHLAALADDPAVVGRDADARPGRGLRVAGDLGATLGAALRAGRPLPEDAADAGAVLLGHAFWRDRLDGREDVIGQTLFLDGRPATVAGILATSARLKPVLGFEPDWWRPLTAEDARDGPSRALAFARLRHGVDAAAAEAELAVLSRRLTAGGGDADRSLRVTPLRAGVDPVARVLVVLVLAAILGIVCLDVGSVLLAGALAREREIAVRLALGAGRGVVAAQLQLEGLLLGLLGGAVGWGLTRAAARALAALSAGTNAEALAIDFDGWLQGTALVVSLAAGLLAGVAPALHARRVRCAVLLNEGVATASGTPRARRLRALLVAGQVALSLTLLTQAGLALSSLGRLLAVDRGFTAAGVLAVPFTGGGPDGPLPERLAGAPGLGAVALASALPAGGPLEAYRLLGPGSEGGHARVADVTPAYFAALGIASRAGRGFADADGATGAAPVAIVNETLAARAGRGASPLGAVVELAGVRRTVIGVVADVRNPPLQSAPRPEIYLPWRPSGRGWILAQAGFARPLAAAGALAEAVEAQPGCRRAGPVRELDRVLAADMGVIRLGTALLSAVALGAALLTAAGTFGVVSFVAGRRAREIGIRLSLGASVVGLRRLVLLQELRPVAAGAALGVLLSLALGRVVASRVHGLRPVEPLVLLGASLLFVALLAAACYLPARRATRVDPAVALRAQ